MVNKPLLKAYFCGVGICWGGLVDLPLPIGSMGRTVYLPTLKTHKNQRTNLGKYTSPMDPMGFSN